MDSTNHFPAVILLSIIVMHFYIYCISATSVRNARCRGTDADKLMGQCVLEFLLKMKATVVLLLTGCFILISGNQLSTHGGGEETEAMI